MASHRDFEKLWEQYQKEGVKRDITSSYIARVKELFMHTSSGGIGTVFARELMKLKL